ANTRSHARLSATPGARADLSRGRTPGRSGRGTPGRGRHRDAPPVGTGAGAGVGVGVGVGVPSSMRILGRIRPSHFGSHQLAGPRSSMVAGTRTSRTSVASTKTATARPRPNILTVGSGSPRKLRKTLIMIS